MVVSCILNHDVNGCMCYNCKKRIICANGCGVCYFNRNTTDVQHQLQKSSCIDWEYGGDTE